MIREATTTLKNLSEKKPQQIQGPETTNDAFCEMICMLLKPMKDGSRKEFLKLGIHRSVVTAIDQNNTVTSPTAVMNRSNSAILSPVPLASISHTFPMMRFGAPPPNTPYNNTEAATRGVL